MPALCPLADASDKTPGVPCALRPYGREQERLDPRPVEPPAGEAPQGPDRDDRDVAVDRVVPAEVDRADEDDAEEAPARDRGAPSVALRHARDHPGRGDVHAGRRRDAAAES